MKTILVVDDEYAIADTLQEFLDEEGFSVRKASNGEKALELIAQERPDLVLMDVMMPILGGVETLERIRKLPELAGLPVVLMSAAPRGVLGDAIESSASGFLRKPFDLDELLEVIREHTGG